MCLSSVPTTGPIFLKGLNDTSRGVTKASEASSKSAGKSPRSPSVEWFALTGVSNPPDPRTHAYRKDLADTALAGRVIASHYADPLVRHLVAGAPFLAAPEQGAELVASLGT